MEMAYVLKMVNLIKRFAKDMMESHQKKEKNI